MDFEAAVLLFFGFLVTTSDARGNTWSQQDGNGWNLQNGGENNFGSWSPEDSQSKDGGNWNNQVGGQDGGRWGKQGGAWSDNTQAKEWSPSDSSAQVDGNQRSGFSSSDTQVKDYGKRNGNFRPEDSQSKDWNRNQGSFGPEDSQSKDWNRNQGSFGPEDSQSKDWNKNQGSFGPQDSQSKDNQASFRPEDSQSKDWNRNQGSFGPEDSQSKDWNRNQNAGFEPADSQRKVPSDWNNGGGRDSQPWGPEEAQVKNENWGQKKIDEGLNQEKIWGQQDLGSNRNWGQGTGSDDGSVVQGGTDWNQGQDRPSLGEGQAGDQGPIRGGPSIGTNQGSNGGRWDGDVSSGRPTIGQGEVGPSLGPGELGPSVGQDQGVNDGRWNGNSFPESIGQSDGQGGIEPSNGQGGIGPLIGQGGIVLSIGQGGVGPGETGVPQDGSIDGERGDSGGDSKGLFPPRVPQGNYKGGDTPHPGDGDTGPWRLEDSIPGQPGVDYPNYSAVPETGFDCKQHENPGYYGDVEARCQVFHICQSDGRHDSFLCPLGTVFNQQYFVCVWWFDYNCEDTQMYYALNADLYKGGEQGNFKGDDYRPPQDTPGRRVDQTGLPGPVSNVGTPDRGINLETVTGPSPIFTEQPDVVPPSDDDSPGNLGGDSGRKFLSPGVTSGGDNDINPQGPVYGLPEGGIPVQNRGIFQQRPGYGQVGQTGPPRLDPGTPPQEGFGQSDVIGQQDNDRTGGSDVQGTGGKRNWGSNSGSSAVDGNWRNGVKGGWKTPDESARGRKARSWGSYDGLEKRFGSEGAAASNWISLEHGLEDEVGGRPGGNVVENNGTERNVNPVLWDEEQTQRESGLNEGEHGFGRKSGGNIIESNVEWKPERNGNQVQWESSLSNREEGEVDRRSTGNIIESNGEWKPARKGNQVQRDKEQTLWGSGLKKMEKEVSGGTEEHTGEREPERNEKEEENWGEEGSQWESGRSDHVQGRQETDEGTGNEVSPRIWRTIEPATNARRNWWQDELGTVKRRRRDTSRWWMDHHSAPLPQRWNWKR